MIDLPDTYPASSLPNVALEFGTSIDNTRRKQLRDALKAIFTELPTGTECLDELVIQLQQAVQQKETQTSEDTSSSFIYQQPFSKNPNPTTQALTKLVLIWSHHILATSKRKFIHDTSKELNLNGVCKPGYPGIIIVEGEAANVDDFVEQIKQLRWQALSVKAEMEYDVGDGGKLGSGGGDGSQSRSYVHEVESVADVTAILRPVGLEEWFLEGMGIRK